MVDPSVFQPVFESPISGLYPAGGGVQGDGDLVMSDESALTKLVVRADADTRAAQQLAVDFGSSRTSGGVLICGQRPTEWLVVGEADDVATFAGALDRGGHVSTIDHTHSRAMMRITGRQATQVLAKVCGLDWDDRMTPDGAVVSASVAKVGCDIARHDLDGTPSFRLACDRSFAQYLFDTLLDAGNEFGMGARL